MFNSIVHVHFRTLRDELRQLQQVTAFQDTNQVYTFFLPNNGAFAAMKNPGSFDANMVRGHIIPGEVLFLRNVNDSFVDVLQSNPDAKGFSTLLAESGNVPECILGYTNSSGEREFSV